MASRYKRPVTPADRAKRDAAREEKLIALHEQLTEQVAALRSGADWRAWLDVASRFHTYSFNNTLLIYAQRPEARAVAGYTAWQALSRQVDKGEKGIQILAPVTRHSSPHNDESDAKHGEEDLSQPPATKSVASTADVNEAGTTRRVVGFHVAYVWDIDQTSGDPLPEQPRPQLLAGQAPEGLWDSLAGLAEARGFAVERGECGPANGLTDYTSRTVRVRPDIDDAQAVKTLGHEIGHVLLHDPADFTTASGGNDGGEAVTVHCRGTKEVEAESVAYLVATSHGMNTNDYTFAYVTGWAANVDGAEPEKVVRYTGQRVLHATRTVLAATQPDVTPTADPSLVARAHAGQERTAAVREHAEATLALVRPPAVDSAVAATHVDTLAQLHAEAASFYTAQLTDGSPNAVRAAAVLAERMVTPAAAAAYELGYAPSGWTALTNHLRARGYTDAQLLDAGVGMTTRRGTVVDRFRDRLIFPVRDATGERVVAFLGRALTEAESAPKYLNSPQTALYRKAEVLYGLGAHPGRQALEAGARPVLVEGPLDAIAVTCAGAGHYVGAAPCGTALTSAQVTVLGRHAGPLDGRGVTTAFDNDASGQEAALRAFGLLRVVGAWPTVATLPGGQDPASLAQQDGPESLRAVLDAAAGTPLADRVVDGRLARWSNRLTWVEGQVGATRDAATLIATLPPEHVGRQVARVAKHTGLDTATVTGEVVEAFIRGANVPGRLPWRDRSDDLDRGQDMTEAPTPARLSRTGYPGDLLRAVTAHGEPISGGMARSAPVPAQHPRPAVSNKPPHCP